MYTDDDLESAVAAGVLSPGAVAALRAHVAHSRQTPEADEENVRFVTSFNDVFVVIASGLLLAAVGWIVAELAPWLGSAAVAAFSWGLAEFFTRRRRMALPSILLLLSFVGGVFFCLVLLGLPQVGEADEPLVMAAAAAMSGLASWGHWRRFRVPITVAAGAAAGLLLAILLLLWGFPRARESLNAIMLLGGLLVFAQAMVWDMRDPPRHTRRSDVAFWLHLLASPLIVHPIFACVGITEGSAGLDEAALVLLLYLLLGLVALVVDRRALLVSALFYVLYAFSELLKEFGMVGLNMAVTGFVIGSALLLLSAFWHASRALLLRHLPANWRRKLPPLK